MAGYNFDAREAANKRRQAIAQRLMGAQLPQGTQFAGNMAVKQGPLEFLAPLLSQGLGMHADKKAAAEEQAIASERNAELAKWLGATQSGAPMDKNQKLGWALQGQQLGPVGQQVGSRALENELFPAQEEAYTLKPGEMRMQGNRMLAQAPERPAAEKPMFGNVNPGDFTPESLAKFAQSKNYGDLVPITKPEAAAKAPEQFQALTPEEIQAAGLPAGTAAQRNAQTGKIDVLSRRDNTGVLSQKDATTAKMKLNTVQLARQQLNAIKEAFTKGREGINAFGPGQGLLPTEAGKKFDARVDQMRSTLTALTRVPGVGAMSDYETKLDQSKFPNRTDYEGVTADKLQQLEDMLALIENGYSGLLSGGDTAPGAPPGSGGQPMQFATEAEAEAAGIKPGTRVIIGGVPGTWQ